jgi:hypothetical protein
VDGRGCGGPDHPLAYAVKFNAPRFGIYLSVFSLLLSLFALGLAIYEGVSP